MRPFPIIVRAALSVALMSPLLGAGTPPDASDVVAAMNRDGLARFAARDDSGQDNLLRGDFASGDYTISPLLLWFDDAIHARATDDATRSVLDRLRRSGITIDAHVRFGVPTNADAAETATAAKLADVKVLAWYFDDVRAARFDTKNGRRSLFLFWGTRDKLDAVRKNLNPGSWATLSSGFTMGAVGLSDVGIDAIASFDRFAGGVRRLARLLVTRDHVVDDDTGAIILLGEHV
jgi:hypothetical protein